MISFLLLKSFSKLAGDRAEVSVDLRGRRAEDQIADGPFGELDVLVGSEDVNFAVGEDDSGLSDVLDGEFGSSAFSSQAT